MGHLRTSSILALAIALAPAASGSASAQPLAGWGGTIRCEIQSTAQGYSHQETQTWTLTGAAPAVQGSVTVYPATWSVTGQGWHDRTRNTTRRMAQWTVNGAAPSGSIGFTLHAGGAGFDVAKRHAQLTVQGGYAGTDETFVNGVSQSSQRLVATLYEWQFPRIDAATSETQLSGSRTAEVKAYVGPLQPPEAHSIVTCSWALGRGSVPALAPASMPAQPPPPPVSDGAVSGGAVPPGSPSSAAPSGAPPAAAQPPVPVAIATRPDLPPSSATPVPPAAAPPSAAATAPQPTSAGAATPVVRPQAPRIDIPPLANPPTRTVPGVPAPSDPVANAGSTGSTPDASASTPSASTPAPASSATASPPPPAPTEPPSPPGTSASTSTSPTPPPGAPAPPSTSAPPTTRTPVDLYANLDLPNLPIGATRYWEPGSTATYVVVVANGGGNNIGSVDGAVLTFTTTPGLSMSTITCSAAGGARCPSNVTASALGQGVTIPSLPASSAARLEISGAVTGSLGSSISVTATVTAPPTAYDWEPRDNSDTVTHLVAVPSTDPGRSPAALAAAGTLTPLPDVSATSSLPCTLSGPAVAPVEAHPQGVRLTWAHINGATYTVSRAGMGVVSPSPLTAALYPWTLTFWHSTPLYHHTTYEYVITAYYGAGCGESRVPVQPPRPWIPTLRVGIDSPASAVGGRWVRLNWAEPAERGDNYGFMVYGPGFPADGKDLPTGCGRTDTVVRCPYWLWEEFFTIGAGTHTWIVAPYWKTENGIMLDVDSGARVTATVPPPEAGLPTVAPAAPPTTTTPGGQP